MITAAEFWKELQKSVQTAEPAKDSFTGSEWTNRMYDVIHRTQRTFDVWCQCKDHPKNMEGASGERLGIDFLWFPNSSGLSLDEKYYPHVLVAIEHENQWNSNRRRYAYWKVSQIGAKLRVFIGYTRHAYEVDEAVRDLQLHESRWFAVPDGETLLIFGHGGMILNGFRAWSATQGHDDWRILGRG